MSTEEFNDTVAEGYIISQVPEYAEGQKLPEGSVIAVTVSKGPQNRPYLRLRLKPDGRLRAVDRQRVYPGERERSV